MLLCIYMYACSVMYTLDYNHVHINIHMYVCVFFILANVVIILMLPSAIRYAWTCKCVHVCMYACAYECSYAFLCVCVYIYIYIYIYMYVCMYVCMYDVCLQIHMYIFD
jgi:hypothetical protein